MKLFSFFVFSVVTALSFQALAEDRATTAIANLAASATGQKCTLQETANVGFSFNSQQTDITQVKAIIDKKIADVKALAAEAGIEKIELQNYNYSVYANNNGGGTCCEGDCAGSGGSYGLNGSANFTVKPIEKTADFAALMSKHGFNTNFNVNAYNQCNGYAD